MSNLMEKNLSDLSPSWQLAAKTLYSAFKALKEAGGELPARKVIEAVAEKVAFNEWESAVYEKSGYIRWQSILYFFSIDCVKAGFLIKSKGKWILTEEGEKAIKLGPVDLLKSANQAYRDWKASRRPNSEETIEQELPNLEQQQKAFLDQLESQASEGIRQYISRMNPYEFQDIVAALLRAMGYYISFIAKRGSDGGVDILAYQDPLGTKTPIIKVQVKHRPDAAIPVDDIRSLSGLLNKEGEIGLFVTSGRFTASAERFARESHTRLELIDFDRFVNLWQEYYNRLNDEEKNMLPLHPIFFLGSNE